LATEANRNGSARGRPSSSTESLDRWGGRLERAVLVGLDLDVRSRGNRAQANAAAAQGARAHSTSLAQAPSQTVTTPARTRSFPAGIPARQASGLDAEESLAEFRELLLSAGGQVAAELLQRRDRPDPATLIGSGKVEEVAAIAASTNADLVLFDHDLSPTQLRNLEAALPCRVLDRTQLILDIFARHARTREGQLQVELAQLEYMLPRLTGRGKAMSQLGGGIGTRGPG